MKRIGDRQFLYAWQIIRAATQPSQECMAWAIGAVECRRHRHSLSGPDHGIVLDVICVTEHERRNGWQVMVTVETWWDARREPFRTQLWATHLAGSRDRALDWFRRRAEAIEAAGRERDGSCV